MEGATDEKRNFLILPLNHSFSSANAAWITIDREALRSCSKTISQEYEGRQFSRRPGSC